jgi:acetolactate synthase-like protein
VTAIKNAQMAESPLVLIGGAAATLLKGRGALQDIDQMALFKPICQCANSSMSTSAYITTSTTSTSTRIPPPFILEIIVRVALLAYWGLNRGHCTAAKLDAVFTTAQRGHHHTAV